MTQIFFIQQWMLHQTCTDQRLSYIVYMIKDAACYWSSVVRREQQGSSRRCLRHTNRRAARAAESLSSEDLVVEVAVAKAVLGPVVEVVGRGNSS